MTTVMIIWPEIGEGQEYRPLWPAATLREWVDRAKRNSGFASNGQVLRWKKDLEWWSGWRDIPNSRTGKGNGDGE